MVQLVARGEILAHWRCECNPQTQSGWGRVMLAFCNDTIHSLRSSTGGLYQHRTQKSKKFETLEEPYSKSRNPEVFFCFFSLLLLNFRYITGRFYFSAKGSYHPPPTVIHLPLDLGGGLPSVPCADVIENNSELPSGIIIKPHFYLSSHLHLRSRSHHHAVPLQGYEGVISIGDNYCARPEPRTVTCLVTITCFFTVRASNWSRTASRTQSFQWANATGAILCCIYATMEWDL